MLTRLAVLAGLAALAAASPASAQRLTEQFIPLGQSPGVSGVSAYLGTISAVDATRRTITISGPAGETTVKVSDTTRIWLDRSNQKQPTVAAKLSDLQVGWSAEVKYLDPAKKEGAEWIKVVPG
jgi:hypothetical protein